MRVLLLLLAGLLRLTAADPTRDARWRQDLDTIATQLPALHPHLFFQTPRSVFNQAVRDLGAMIPQLSDSEVIVELARLVVLPLNMRWFEDGLPGLWQINVRAADSAVVSGQVPVFVVIGSTASNAVTMKVGNAK